MDDAPTISAISDVDVNEDESTSAIVFVVTAIDADDDEADFTVTAETLCFLLKNNFGRGTVTINGRIQFNYPSAHRFFIFFFVPYANNIGIQFRDGRLDAGKLQSIARTSVMMSILQASAEARANFDRDLLAFG